MLIHRHAAEHTAPFRIVDYTYLVGSATVARSAEATVRSRSMAKSSTRRPMAMAPSTRWTRRLPALGAFYPHRGGRRLQVRILDGGAATAADRVID